MNHISSPSLRSNYNNPFEDEPYDKNHAWQDIIRLAATWDHQVNFKELGPIYLERGEAPLGTNFLAKRWKWSRGKVLKFLKKLEGIKLIVKKGSSKKTSLSIYKLLNFQQYLETPAQKGSRKGSSEEAKKDHILYYTDHKPKTPLPPEERVQEILPGIDPGEPDAVNIGENIVVTKEALKRLNKLLVQDELGYWIGEYSDAIKAKKNYGDFEHFVVRCRKLRQADRKVWDAELKMWAKPRLYQVPNQSNRPSLPDVKPLEKVVALTEEQKAANKALLESKFPGIYGRKNKLLDGNITSGHITAHDKQSGPQSDRKHGWSSSDGEDFQSNATSGQQMDKKSVTG